VKTRDKKKVKKCALFWKKTIYSLLQVHFPGNLILDFESSVNFTSETPTLKFFTTLLFRKYYH